MKYRELTELVAGEPEARAPNLVVADWLSERGDPRGELGMLFDRVRSASPQERTPLVGAIRALAAEHLEEWTGVGGAQIFDVEYSEPDDLVAIHAGHATFLFRWTFLVGIQSAGGFLDPSGVWDRPGTLLQILTLTEAEAGRTWRTIEGRDERDLSLLTTVGLFSSALDEGDFRALGALPNLLRFGLHDCRGVTDAGVQHVARRGLRALSLGTPGVSPAILYKTPLFDLESLEITEADRPFDGQDLSCLEDAHRLRRLLIRPVAATENELRTLIPLKSLRELSLQDVPSIGPVTLEVLQEMEAIEGVQITTLGEEPTDLWSLGSTELVELTGDPFALELLESLCQLRFVRGLSVTRSSQLGDDMLVCLESLPDLRALALDDCPDITGAFLRRLTRFPRFRFLRLDRCSGLREGALEGLSALRGLRALSLYRCTQLDGRFLEHLRPEVETLNLGGIDLDDGAFEGLLALEDLRRLDLSETELSNERLARLVARMPHMEDLSLRRCRGITPDGFLQLLGLPRLQRLEVAGTGFRHRQRFEQKYHEAVISYSPDVDPAWPEPDDFL